MLKIATTGAVRVPICRGRVFEFACEQTYDTRYAGFQPEIHQCVGNRLIGISRTTCKEAAIGSDPAESVRSIEDPGLTVSGRASHTCNTTVS